MLCVLCGTTWGIKECDRGRERERECVCVCVFTRTWVSSATVRVSMFTHVYAISASESDTVDNNSKLSVMLCS